ncbi:Opioid-binding protein/cell adhesion molecule -like protein [Echinococcus granulosus]|uniref:Neurotracting:lsamp:neurotrimin:obcam n=1 Tax=Echinococcus granulosus TaxID=6210 RepID=A0A068WF49_ECHGR|nr:Opioid-binding protein/cell adhesion molecule -like protein [Echinococcus granulosus]CDS17071.1 neurotracting:lsamp:neurotrimin:obcam [Echinococcus granulosus]
MTPFRPWTLIFLVLPAPGLVWVAVCERIHNAINGSRVELSCDLDVPFTKTELDAMSWIKAPRQILSLGMYKVTEDERISIVPPTLLKKRGFNLLIYPVTKADNGMYRCSIAIGGDTQSKTYRLNVLLPPRITKAPGPILKVVEGDALQVSCFAEGNPPPVVTWLMEVAKGGIQILPLRFTKDGFELARNVLKSLSVDFVEMNGYLQISQINRQMSGTLACQAVNGVEPKAVRKMRLDIRFPPEIQVANSLIKQSLGGDTVLQCQVNANPMGIVLWTFGKAKTPINASSCSILTNKAVKYCVVDSRQKHEERWPSVISKLHILRLTEEDFGDYTCGMITMMGKHAASTTLERYVAESEQSMRLFNDPFFNLPLQTTTTMPILDHQYNLDSSKDSLYGYSHFREKKKPLITKVLYADATSAATQTMPAISIILAVQYILER